MPIHQRSSHRHSRPTFSPIAAVRTPEFVNAQQDTKWLDFTSTPGSTLGLFAHASALVDTTNVEGLVPPISRLSSPPQEAKHGIRMAKSQHGRGRVTRTTHGCGNLPHSRAYILAKPNTPGCGDGLRVGELLGVGTLLVSAIPLSHFS